jgi:WD40 repeat protein
MSEATQAAESQASGEVKPRDYDAFLSYTRSDRPVVAGIQKGLHRIVSGSYDSTLRLWNADTGDQIGNPLTSHTGEVDSVAFSRDGRRIASGGADKTVRLWPGPVAWSELLCDKLAANMSRKQWHDWVSPDIPYFTACQGLPIAPD